MEKAEKKQKWWKRKKNDTAQKDGAFSAEPQKLEDVIEDIIIRRHNYYSKQDKKYKRTVSCMRIIIALLSCINTIVLGVRAGIPEDIRISIGLVLSAISTFVAGILAYYNFEKYWMRNITKHIKLNVIRDSFNCDKAAKKLTEDQLKHYKDQLEAIEKDNIDYWKKASNKIMEKEEV